MPDSLGRRDSVPTKQLLAAMLHKLGLASMTITEDDLARVADETSEVVSSRTDDRLRPGTYVVQRVIPRPVIGVYRPQPGQLAPALDKALRRGPEGS